MKIKKNQARSWIGSLLLALLISAMVGCGRSRPEGGSGAAQATQQTRPSLKETEMIDLGDGVQLELVLIRPGSFMMGSSTRDYDESPVHQVTLTEPYYIGKYEVTQAQWEKVMGENPSHFKGSSLPVDNVSWEDCQRFLVELRKKAGRRFALPTEAQWEYACRAGTTTAYSFGDDEKNLAEHAWYAGNSELKTHPVGEKKPNPWGLYDIHGNVFEWCADWYSEAYHSGDATDPSGAPKGERRIVRGGAWLYVSDNLRSSDRGFSPADYRINEYGLRCVMLTGDGPATNAATDQAGGPVAQTSAKDPVPSAASEKTESLLVQLEAAVAASNKFHAENLLAELETLVPRDPRLASLRSQISTLAAPEENLVIDLAKGVTMEFVLIRPGSFTMGSSESPLDDQKPTRRVTITQPYYLGKYEVTQQQWEAIMSRNLSVFKGGALLSDPAKLPVENINWPLCQSFLAALNERLNGYTVRLPTEAEWEYACRAGTTGEHSFPGEAALKDYAWYGGNAGGQTHPVGGKKPNPWGLYDMYGNVWEWCQDWYGPYSAEAVLDPTGPTVANGLSARVVRGGAWNNTADHVNSTYRHDVGSTVMMRYYGFRCVAVMAPDKKAEGR